MPVGRKKINPFFYSCGTAVLHFPRMNLFVRKAYIHASTYRNATSPYHDCTRCHSLFTVQVRTGALKVDHSQCTVACCRASVTYPLPKTVSTS